MLPNEHDSPPTPPPPPPPPLSNTFEKEYDNWCAEIGTGFNSISTALADWVSDWAFRLIRIRRSGWLPFYVLSRIKKIIGGAPVLSLIRFLLLSMSGSFAYDALLTTTGVYVSYDDAIDARLIIAPLGDPTDGRRNDVPKFQTWLKLNLTIFSDIRISAPCGTLSRIISAGARFDIYGADWPLKHQQTCGLGRFSTLFNIWLKKKLINRCQEQINCRCDIILRIIR